MISYSIIGLMSGTSLDGLDICHAILNKDEHNNWSFSILNANTFSYPEDLTSLLSGAMQLPAPALFSLDKEIGNFFGKTVLSFLEKHAIDKTSIHAIASHGHTVFHQPEKGFTVQIGCGSTISLLTGIPVINDFRTKDVILGGQGAPLVPIGDFKLFKKEAEAFLNIGGISNISFEKDGVIRAFDCAPGNLPLNKLAGNKGLPYDKNGELARKGEINFFLLNLLNELEFYSKKDPKSLGAEWFEQHFYPLIKFDRDIDNNLRTIVEHIALQIGNVLNENKLSSVFITGGGAMNTFLTERIGHYFKGEIIIPPVEIISFKEALIFAFLGALYLEKEPNCLSVVTGASRDVCGGVLHLPG